MRLFLLLVAVPIIEIALFIEIGGWLGTWPTIGIVVLTALLGPFMLRQQGLKALGDIQGRLMAGDDPGQMLADGAMILVSGVLLLTPGFFTDAVGFLLLVPGVRKALFNWGRKNIRMNVHTAHANTQRRPGWPLAGGETVDGDYEDITPPDQPDPRSDNHISGKPD